MEINSHCLNMQFLGIFQDCMFHRNIIGDLKTFIDKYAFDVLVILANYLTEEEQTKQQIAVYSENVELCNQVSIFEKNNIFL